VVAVSRAGVGATAVVVMSRAAHDRSAVRLEPGSVVVARVGRRRQRHRVELLR